MQIMIRMQKQNFNKSILLKIVIKNKLHHNLPWIFHQLSKIIHKIYLKTPKAL